MSKSSQNIQLFKQHIATLKQYIVSLEQHICFLQDQLAMQNIADQLPEREAAPIRLLPRHLVDRMDSLPDCPICHESFRDDREDCSMLLCGHPFHQACLTSWSAIRDDCPTCRTPF